MIPDKLTLLFAIVNFGSLVMLSFLKFTNPLKVNRIGNLWFGVFLLLWASYWIEEVTLLILGNLPSLFWQFIYRSIQGFGPVVLYFSVKYYANPGYNIRKAIHIWLLLPLVYMGLLYLNFFWEFSWTGLSYILIALNLGQSMFFSVISFLTIRKHQKTVLLYSSDTKAVNLFWLEHILVIIMFIVVVTTIFNVFFSPTFLNLFMNIIMLILILYIAFHSMRQKEIFPFSETAREEMLSFEDETEFEKEKNKILQDEELIGFKTKLNQFMHSRKPYLDPDLNLIKLAEQFGISPHRLSYIINNGYNINFSNFISNYRIEEAKSLLLNPKFDQYSILGIAFESGFNSKTSFNNTFKKITGLTPSEFMKSGS